LERFAGEHTEPEFNTKEVKEAVESTRILINMNDHLYQLSHVWGNKGGFLAVKELTDKINELIQEYYDSGDMEEAIRCLKDLNVPHFHHEFVFEALDFTLQKGDKAIELISNLLKRLCVSVIITYDQLKTVILLLRKTFFRIHQ
jgi:programmed cell death protein 4